MQTPVAVRGPKQPLNTIFFFPNTGTQITSSKLAQDILIKFWKRCEGRQWKKKEDWEKRQAIRGKHAGPQSAKDDRN